MDESFSEILGLVLGQSSAMLAALGAFIAFFALYSQRDHNRKSVIPIPKIAQSDYTQLIEIEITNQGTGPLKIKKFTASTTDGEDSRNLIELMPDLPLGEKWTSFYVGIDDAVLRPGERITILKLSGENGFSFDANRRYVDVVRRTLYRTTTCIEYTDVYGTHFERELTKLDLFAEREELPVVVDQAV